MEDQLIIGMFFERSEKAISELMNKYGRRCKTLSLGILGNESDAEECVNDAYLAVWNAIPPTKPDSLGAYVAKITRNLAISRYRKNVATKRNAKYDACVEELEEILCSNETVESTILQGELKGAVNRFLETLDRKDRMIFVERFWYCRECPEIARELGKNKNYVNVRLHRIKERLKKFLMTEELL